MGVERKVETVCESVEGEKAEGRCQPKARQACRFCEMEIVWEGCAGRLGDLDAARQRSPALFGEPVIWVMHASGPGIGTGT